MATDTYYPKVDGVVTSVMNSSKYLAEKGHKVVILCPKYEKQRDKKIENIQIYRFKSFSFPTYKEVKVPIPDIKKIVQIFKKFKPDIVHIHTPGTLGLLSLILAKRSKIKIVNTYHTSLPDVLVYVSPSKLIKLDKIMDKIIKHPRYKKLEPKLSKIKKRFEKLIKFRKKNSYRKKLIWAISKRFYLPSDLVIAPSLRIHQELKKNGINSIVISNGIELSLFKPKTKYSKFPKFLHVGRLGFEKRVDVIINAWKIVKKKYPKAKLTIVGDGPARDSLEKQSQGLDIKFIGFVERKKLPSIYRKHDVFVTASEMETQGLVILEAMASGLAVLGVNVLAIPDVVHNNENGFLVRKRSPKSMAKKMIYLIENPEIIEKLGTNARKEAEKHDLNTAMIKLEEAYQKILITSTNNLV